MPYCSVCRYEYQDGITRCPDCDVDLVNQLPPVMESAESYIEDGFVKVYAAADEMEARVVAATLEEAGIKTWDRSQIIHSLKTYIVGPLAPEEILVLECDAERARAAIQQALADGEKIDETGASPTEA